MVIHQQFGDWYRSATLTPTEDLLQKRWTGIEDLVKQPTAPQLLGLAKLFTLPHATEAVIPAGFRESFRAHDDLFPLRDNLQELRILAGIVLRFVIETKEHWAPLAALAIACGSFGAREANLPGREHLQAAERFLVEYSRKSRASTEPAPLKIPTLTKAKMAETLQQGFFAVNQTPNLYEPLLNTLADLASSFSATLKQAQSAIHELTELAKVREEEVSILWWLQTHFSRSLQKSFSEMGYLTGTLVLPMELADLTVFVPGSEVAVAVLVHALMLAGAPSSSETLTIVNATNGTPREWRENVCEKYKIDASGLLTPVLMALHKSLETEGRDEWLPVYRKACDIPGDRPLPLLQISLQLYRERMLLRALSEVAS
jgi:hypothetical protein